MMSSIRSQLELLDEKMAQLQLAVGQEGEVVVPIDLDISGDDLPFADDADNNAGPEPIVDSEPEPVVEPEPEPLLLLDPAPLPEPAAVQTEQPSAVKAAVIDSMAAKQAWRTDMPGTQVKDIRSAISLNDRILFINYLFGEDPIAFQESLSKINQMLSLDEVLDYLVSSYPDWDFESDVVYRFMMAVRRRIR